VLHRGMVVLTDPNRHQGDTMLARAKDAAGQVRARRNVTLKMTYLRRLRDGAVPGLMRPTSRADRGHLKRRPSPSRSTPRMETKTSTLPDGMLYAFPAYRDPPQHWTSTSTPRHKKAEKTTAST